MYLWDSARARNASLFVILWLITGERSDMSEVRSFVDEGVWAGADGVVYTYGKAQEKSCKSCRKTFPWDGNKYKNHCVPCYKKIVRTCSACKVNKLKADAPAYQHVCTSCWLTEKAKRFKACPRCPPSRATHLRCPLDAECCPECAIRCQPLPPIVGLSREGEQAPSDSAEEGEWTKSN